MCALCWNGKTYDDMVAMLRNADQTKSNTKFNYEIAEARRKSQELTSMIGKHKRDNT